jgi:hypothetical protein
MYYGWNVAAPASNVMMDSAACTIVLALSIVKALVFGNHVATVVMLYTIAIIFIGIDVGTGILLNTILLVNQQ